jgi:general secretion pathway protein A
MYKSFFNLSRNPFELTPDPRCFVPTQSHNEALATLHYGVRQHKGFVVVTGEVGTGKTLLIRCLLRLLGESKDIAYSYLFNGRLTPLEFLEYITTDFGLSGKGKNKAELIFELGQYFVSRGANGLTTVLILDEAHNLSEDLLEEVRLLSNLETLDDKLLQILLLGQPELDYKLDSFALRQLKQRVALRTHLEPLSAEEIKGYIERRLRVAGAAQSSGSFFPAPTITAIHRYSKGFPRLINSLCENALIAAYAKRTRCITPEIIETVAADLRIDVDRVVAMTDVNRYEGSSYGNWEQGAESKRMLTNVQSPSVSVRLS